MQANGITVSIGGVTTANAHQVGKTISDIGVLLAGEVAGTPVAATMTTKPTRARGPAKMVTPEPETEETEEMETSSDEEETFEDEEEETGPTLKDVTTALKKFSARGAEYASQAKAVLKKYKVKHVDELPKNSYAAVIKAVR